MKSTYNYKDIWQIAWPIILGNIAQNIVNVTDTAFLGHYGRTELAASAIAGVFYFALFMIGFGLATGSQIIIARRNGEKALRQIGITIEHTLYLLLFFSSVLFVLIQLFAPAFLSKVVDSPEIYIKSVQYLTYRSWGLFFSFTIVSIGAFFIGITRTKILSVTHIIMAGTNVFLDWLLIFGHWGFEPMGISGAAIASAISEAVAMCFILIYTFTVIDRKKYYLFYFRTFKIEHILHILKIAMPVMVQFLFSLGAWFTFFLFVEKTGEFNLAVSNIIRSYYMILLLPVWGFTAAANTLTSNLIGQKKTDEVMITIWKTVKLCFYSILILIAANIFIPEQIISIYTNDSNLIAGAVNIMYLINLALVVFSVAMILFNGVSGTGNTIISMTIEIITILLYIIYVFYQAVIAKNSLFFIWSSEVVYALIIGTFSIIYLYSNHWKKIKI